LSSESLAIIDFIEHYWFHAFGIHIQVDDCQSGITDSIDVINEVFELIKLGHIPQAMTFLIARIDYIRNGFVSCASITQPFS